MTVSDEQRMASRIAALEARVAILELSKAVGISIPPKPTTLERVAGRIACSTGDGWGEWMTSAQKGKYLCQARAAVEALKIPRDESLLVETAIGRYQLDTGLYNAYLDSILAEGQK